MNTTLLKLGVACTSSVMVVEAVNLEPLWNALITLAISIVSVLTVDGIAWLKNKIKKDMEKDKKDEENKKEE